MAPTSPPLGLATGALYAIVDVPGPAGLGVAAITRGVLAGRLQGGADGAAIVQLRAKHATTAERLEMLRAMVGPCREAGAALVVNDDVEAALRGPPEIAGVHLGQEDPEAADVAAVRSRALAAGRANLWVGLSTHNLAQLRAAGRQAPDYLALGPVAATHSKANPDPIVGLGGLVDACRVASRPVVAIGGLDRASGCAAIEAGAWAVAVIGALRGPTEVEIVARARGLARAFRGAAAPLALADVHARIPAVSIAQLEELAHWADHLGMHIELGLPARFRPIAGHDGSWLYRPSDVIDLLHALDKRPLESWHQWSARQSEGNSLSSRAGWAQLVKLRRD